MSRAARPEAQGTASGLQSPTVMPLPGAAVFALSALAALIGLRARAQARA